MSATKEYASKVEAAYETADLDVYGAVVALTTLADLAWAGDHAVWAPDEVWLAATRLQLQQLSHTLQELEAARDCLNYTQQG